MIKTVKGAYNSGTSYDVGDVVQDSGRYYVLQHEAAAGTHPTDTRYWGQLVDPDVIDALDLISGVQGGMNELHPNSKELVLASSTANSKKKFKITVVDNGTISATEIT